MSVNKCGTTLRVVSVVFSVSHFLTSYPSIFLYILSTSHLCDLHLVILYNHTPILPPLYDNRPQTMSSEEGMYFSVGGTDRTVRCWDQRDQQESYQFLVPGKVQSAALPVAPYIISA